MSASDPSFPPDRDAEVSAGDRDRFVRLCELFEAASSLGPEERAGFLSAIADADLRKSLLGMLDADSSGATAIRTLVDVGAILDDRSHAIAVPESIAGYRILSVIGYGASGVVLKARQPETDRIVAVKVLGSGVWNPNALARFRREIRLLGRLEHPRIARVYGAGTDTDSTPARPYFVMEFVEGETLHQWLRSRERPRNEILRMFLGIVEAVGYAHGRGIVHRDLKPANILVGADDLPKILDFGVAGMRADAGDDETLATLTPAATRSLVSRTGAVLGTVPYMAPEQFDGTRAVDARADLYAIGVMLYEALAKRPPYVVDHRGIAQAAITVSTEVPSTLGRVDRSLRGDLETIVAKLLEKDAAARHQSAGELAEDLRLYLDGRPTRTRPLSRRERVRRFARRYRTLLVVTALAFVVLSSLLAATSVLWRTAVTRSQELAAALEETQRTNYVRALRHADAALRAGLVGDARVALESTERGQRGWEWRYLAGRAAGESAVVPLGRQPMSIACVGGVLLVGDEGLGRSSGVWMMLGSDAPAKRIASFESSVSDLAISPDGDEWIVAVARGEGSESVRSTLDGSVVRRLGHGIRGVWSVDWSQDGRLAAIAGTDAAFAVVDARDGRSVLVDRAPAGATKARPGIIRFVPGGTHVVVAQASVPWAHLVPLDGSAWTELRMDGTQVERLAVCGTGAPGGGPVVIASGNDGTISRFDGRTGELLGRILGHRGVIRAVRAGPAPGQFTTGASDQIVRVWDARDGSLVGEAIGSEREVLAVGVDAVAGSLVAVGSDGKFRAWDLASQVYDPVFRGHRAWAYGVAFDRRGRVISTGGEHPVEDGRILLWDPVTREVEGSSGGPLGAKTTIVVKPVVDPLGGVAATFWDGASRRQGGVAFLDGDRLSSFRIDGVPPYGSVFLHGGEVLAVRRFNIDAVEFYARDGAPLASLAMPRRGFTPPIVAMGDGRSLWTADAEGLVEITLDRASTPSDAAPHASEAADARDASESPGWEPIVVRRIPFAGAVRTLSVDAAGRQLAAGAEDGRAVLFDLARDPSNALRWSSRIHENAATRVALSPDGARLATAGGDVGIRIWDTATGEPLLFLVGHGDEVIDLAFSSDGHFLASGSIDRTVRIWDGRPLESRPRGRDAWSGADGAGDAASLD